MLRVVKYTADKHNGFQAEVITSGGHKDEEVVHHGHDGGHGLGDEEEHQNLEQEHGGYEDGAEGHYEGHYDGYY